MVVDTFWQRREPVQRLIVEDERRQVDDGREEAGTLEVAEEDDGVVQTSCALGEGVSGRRGDAVGQVVD